MRISDIANRMIQNQQLQKRNATPGLPNGSLPPKGHVNPFEDPYMDITGKDPLEYEKIVPVDEDVANQLKDLVKECFVKRNGMCGTGADADAEANIIKKYVATLPGEQKLAAIYTCQQISLAEARRFSAKIRENNPTWQYGQPFDTSILDDTRSLNRIV